MSAAFLARVDPDIDAAAARISGNPVAAAAIDFRPVVAAVFERVLQRDAIGNEDDFFDLGGNSILGIMLINEIAKATGQNLPVTTIYDAPTIDAMAALLASGARIEGKRLVLFKPGELTHPLYIVHGLGGSVMELHALANQIETDQAVYGIEARGLDGTADPLDRVEAMADLYVEEVRRFQPVGPYHLAGFSFGGLVALEMARLLSRSGDAVGLVALLDSFPHTRYWPIRCRIMAWLSFLQFYGSGKLWRRHFDYHRGVLRSKSLAEKPLYVVTRTAQGVAMLFNIFRLGDWVEKFAEPDNARGSAGIALPDDVSRVQDAGKRAFAAYRPGFYEGEIKLLKATTNTSVYFDAASLWGPLARKISVYPVPGNHKDLIKTSAPQVAKRLGSFLGAEAIQAIPDSEPRHATVDPRT